mmetsp:Transcript_28701/g.72162  ORF Transcript_28701/g.72162 Transcript_28701/m.72162 type:complete len:276 (+) Transcript_28701:116-943(+)
MSASPTGDLSFSFEFKDGHIVAALPALDFTDFKPHPSEVKKTYYALVDSGSPITIGRQHGTLCFGEKEFDVAPHTTGMVNTTIDVLSELAGFEFDILIGCNVLAAFDVVINLKDHKVSFSDKELPITKDHILVPTTFVMGLPIFVCKTPLVDAGADARFFFDTGATVGYATEVSLVTTVSSGVSQEEEEVEDFYPSVGKYKTRSFRVPITILGNKGDDSDEIIPLSHKMKIAALPPRLEALAHIATGVIGTELLEHYEVTFLFRRSLTLFTPLST